MPCFFLALLPGQNYWLRMSYTNPTKMSMALINFETYFIFSPNCYLDLRWSCNLVSSECLSNCVAQSV